MYSFLFHEMTDQLGSNTEIIYFSLRVLVNTVRSHSFFHVYHPSPDHFKRSILMFQPSVAYKQHVVGPMTYPVSSNKETKFVNEPG